MSAAPQLIELDAQLKRLHLASSRRIWRELCARAEKEEWTYQHLLEVLFSEEVAQRKQTRLTKLTRWADFPFLKTIDDYDFTHQSTLRLSMIGSLLSPDFVTQGQNVIFWGKPGRGKTHLAIALAYRAIQNGFDARFTTAAALIEELADAGSKNQLQGLLNKYIAPHVLVVDEVGYLTYGSNAANVLFHVVNARHLGRRAMIFTTNKAPQQWGRVLHDEDLGDAIVDRILERGRVIKLDGPSIRSKHVDPSDLQDVAAVPSNQPAIISGTDRPQFPEPTPSGDSMVRARICWLSEGEGGSATIPTGPTYSTAARFERLREQWPREAWSIVAEFLGSPDEKGCLDARVRLLNSEGPPDLLGIGSRFDLFEGARLVAHGVVLGVEP